MAIDALMHSFDRFEDARGAREALIAAGLPGDAVELRVIEDEAGPVEGNFVIGNGRGEDDNSSTTQLLDAPSRYEPNLERPVSRGVHLLLVQPANEMQRQQAQAVLDRHPGAVDIAARQARA
jgi:hypothetical protein